jgi:hypothetical protein
MITVFSIIFGILGYLAIAFIVGAWFYSNRSPIDFVDGEDALAAALCWPIVLLFIIVSNIFCFCMDKMQDLGDKFSK